VIIASNTSPIINLASINQLELLSKLYENILIPEAVYQEIVIIGAGQPGSLEVKEFDWINFKPVENQILTEALKIELDDGEAEAISLAIEKNADLLLIDERLGRQVASRFGIKFIGVLGIIVEAKAKGLVDQVKPLLDDLKSKAGFWMNDSLYSKIVEIAKE
jgi:predicted nucleic acid-binding protein